MHLIGLSDHELVSRLSSLCREGHALTAPMVVHLIEVGAAFRRINAARLVKRFPSLLARIERGELHLSTLVLLRPHLTEANADELAASVAGRTQRQVEELLARLAPKPDVPSAIVELGALRSEAGTPRARIEPLSEAARRAGLVRSAIRRLTNLDRDTDFFSVSAFALRDVSGALGGTLVEGSSSAGLRRPSRRPATSRLRGSVGRWRNSTYARSTGAAYARPKAAAIIGGRGTDRSRENQKLRLQDSNLRPGG